MNFDLKIEALAQLLGEKEVTIFVLNQRVKELEAKLAEFDTAQSAKVPPEKLQALRPA